MKIFKIHGEINVSNETDLNTLCELFNRLQDENNFGFSGVITDSESPTETFFQENN